MSFKIQIKNLGPVKDSEIEFSPFMIFTGESNTGKSYTAFLVYYFLKFIFEPNEASKQYFNSKYKDLLIDIKTNKKTIITLDIVHYIKWLNKYAPDFLNYLLGSSNINCNINFKVNISEINFEISKKEFQTGQNKKLYYQVTKHNWLYYTDIIDNDISILFIDILIAELFNINRRQHYGTFIFPPGRAPIMGLSFSEKQTLASLGIYKEFYRDFDLINSPEIKIDNKFRSLIEILQKTIINGNISFKNDKPYYIYQNMEIPLTAASSAIKEISPLIIALNKINPNSLSFLIEEPEAHLHPSLQMNIANLLAYIINNEGFVQITTHSDYLLSHIGNLIKLNNLKEKNTSDFNKACKEIDIDPSLALPSNRVKAYNFHKNSKGDVKIKSLDLSTGIPFDSFKKSIETLISNTNKIDNYLYKE